MEDYKCAKMLAIADKNNILELLERLYDEEQTSLGDIASEREKRWKYTEHELHSLEDYGLVESSEYDGSRTLYRLTDAGVETMNYFENLQTEEGQDWVLEIEPVKQTSLGLMFKGGYIALEEDVGADVGNAIVEILDKTVVPELTTVEVIEYLDG